ncbi:putative oxidative stress response protein Oxr1 [Aspergillus affinis]|uniref:putative oxidative stress response protein Oxr1 n=1 Tax=Aspergillus affinis TaxID=1070780 RepID=UPI0022FF0378|nr:putative oxidative stress response protein Oxr1 [Aspergillus affinis]KAI9045541.1 putative oxidative stress response protein Oxr1 [Aspergillus affinis]
MESTSHGDPPSSSRSTSRTRQKKSQSNQSASSYFSYPVTHVVSGLYRRLTDPPSKSNAMGRSQRDSKSSLTSPNESSSSLFTPVRTVSPFQPPPLTPLTLTGDPFNLQQQLLTRALAEEIRLLVPARLQLVDTWRLAYSLDRDGASLATLYENCREISNRSPRAGYVLIVRDSSPAGAVFGAYMTDPPHPNPHYFGTGECFLWRASILPPPGNLTFAVGGPPPSEDLLEMAGLPPPPSADTTNVGRSTTLRGDKKGATSGQAEESCLAPPLSGGGASGASTPDRIRFKAFPYSGVNDYMMFCETGFLSLGGGDGRYGLWVDSSFEKGVSSACQTFGNEPLSDEGDKFDVIGVEVWYVGA